MWKHERDAAEGAFEKAEGRCGTAAGAHASAGVQADAARKEAGAIPLVFAAIMVKPPERKHGRSVPGEGRPRFLRRARADDLPQQGRKSESLPFPPLEDEYWEPTIWVLDDHREYFAPKLKPDRLVLAKQYANWLKSEYGGTWG